MTRLCRPNTIRTMNDAASPPDVGPSQGPGRIFYGWWILAVCSLLAVCGGAVGPNLSFFTIPLRDELNFSLLSTGLTFTIAAAAGRVAGLLVGWLTDRFGSRPLVLFGGLAAGVGLTLSSLADSYWHFLLTFAVAFAGTTFGFSMITLLATVNRWFIRQRPVAMATLMTMFSVGSASLPLLVALGMSSLSWRETLLFFGVFLCGLTALGCLVLRSRPEDMGLRPDGEAVPANIPDFTVRQSMRTGAFWVLVLGGMLLNDAADSTIEEIPLSLKAVTSLLAILLTFGMGVAAGRIPPRKILAGGLITGALGHLALLLLDNDVGTVAFLSASAVVQGGGAVYWIMAGDYFGRSRFASLMGVLLLLRAVAVLVPGVVAALLEEMGYYGLSLVFYVLVYAAASVALWFAQRPSRLLSAASLGREDG